MYVQTLIHIYINTLQLLLSRYFRSHFSREPRNIQIGQQILWRAPNNLYKTINALVQQFPNKQEELINKFREKTGGTTCKELKWGEIGCSELVDVAIGLVQ
ncbi:Conserved_hypothetical protein [Hexamita inflata]|uniref:Uncharacterized protein n=1 Tax=Hexamita inflata TaxID=28002 RepID=A0AA86N5G8_9EUKA|nr:Conserved hypothetical protein [Hexamita inflata]